MVAIALVRHRLEHQNFDEVAAATQLWPLRRLLRASQCARSFVVSNKEPNEREVLVYPLVHRWQIRIEVAAIRPATYQRELTCRQPEPRWWARRISPEAIVPLVAVVDRPFDLIERRPQSHCVPCHVG